MNYRTFVRESEGYIVNTDRVLPNERDAHIPTDNEILELFLDLSVEQKQAVIDYLCEMLQS